jgi:hypothetical protein
MKDHLPLVAMEDIKLGKVLGDQQDYVRELPKKLALIRTSQVKTAPS